MNWFSPVGNVRLGLDDPQEHLYLLYSVSLVDTQEKLTQLMSYEPQFLLLPQLCHHHKLEVPFQAWRLHHTALDQPSSTHPCFGLTHFPRLCFSY